MNPQTQAWGVTNLALMNKIGFPQWNWQQAGAYLNTSVVPSVAISTEYPVNTFQMPSDFLGSYAGNPFTQYNPFGGSGTTTWK
jgi:hypothetical protein